MKSCLLFVALIVNPYTVLSQECGSDYGDEEPKEGITNLKQYPSIGTINYINRNGKVIPYGKAVLISSRYALTTAVNVKQKTVKPLNIHFGDQNIQTEVDCAAGDPNDCAPAPVVSEIEEMIAHPQYDEKKYDNDIAIIKLKEDIKYSEYIQPICLPEEDEEIEDEENLYFSTYSNIGPFATKETGIRRTLIIPQRNIEQCAQTYKPKFTALPTPLTLLLTTPAGILSTVSLPSIAVKGQNLENTETKICAGSEGRDGCRGDSGAALMRRNETSGQWTALGLMSFGVNKCGQKDFPSVYTKVSKYLDWINGIINENDAENEDEFM